MFRVTLLLALLGVAHCVVWGFHHHHSGPDDSGSGPDFSGSGPDSSMSGPGGSGPNGSDSCAESNEAEKTWHTDFDKRFKKLSDYIIRADRYAKNLCERFTPNDVQESRENSMYTLTYSMPQFDPANIAVKIKHRVLYMYARQSDSNGAPTFVDIRVLPDISKISDATWTYVDDKLVINIPDDMAQILKTAKTCTDLNIDVKDVPQRSPIIYKFGQ